MPQHPVARPRRELDLADQVGLHELGSLRRPRLALEGRAGALALREQPAEPVELLVVEAGADATRVAQRALVVVVADEDRADPVAPPALAREPAADHELLAGEVLDLDPARAAAARLVRPVEPLGDDALEALLARGPEQRRAGTDV